MKKYLILCIILCIATLSGCSSETTRITDESDEQTKIITETYTYKTLRIIDGAEKSDVGELILAGTQKDEVYSLKAKDISIIMLDGKDAELKDLQDGMTIDVYYEGDFNNVPSKAGQITDITSFCKAIKGYSIGCNEDYGGTYYDLCGLYLKVLEDLWETNDGLNNNIKYISVDLSKAPGNLTNAEKSAISYIFAKHTTKSIYSFHMKNL